MRTKLTVAGTALAFNQFPFSFCKAKTYSRCKFTKKLKQLYLQDKWIYLLKLTDQVNDMIYR